MITPENFRSLFSLLELCYFWRSAPTLEEVKYCWRSIFESAYEIYGTEYITEMNENSVSDSAFILNLEGIIITDLEEMFT